MLTLYPDRFKGRQRRGKDEKARCGAVKVPRTNVQDERRSSQGNKMRFYELFPMNMLFYRMQ